MTFVGFNVDRFGNLLDPDKGNVLEERIMNPSLIRGLKEQHVELSCNFKSWPRFV